MRLVVAMRGSGIAASGSSGIPVVAWTVSHRVTIRARRRSARRTGTRQAGRKQTGESRVDTSSPRLSGAGPEKLSAKLSADRRERIGMSKSDIPAAIRELVYTRDGYRCRWCGRTNDGMHIHHIDYRSAGGLHVPANLITLCPPHHRLVHTNKGLYPPLLLRLLELGVGVTGLQLRRWQILAEVREAQMMAEVVREAQEFD